MNQENKRSKLPTSKSIQGRLFHVHGKGMIVWRSFVLAPPREIQILAVKVEN